MDTKKGKSGMPERRCYQVIASVMHAHKAWDVNIFTLTQTSRRLDRGGASQRESRAQVPARPMIWTFGNAKISIIIRIEDSKA